MATPGSFRGVSPPPGPQPSVERHLAEVLDLRAAGKAMPDQLAPFLEIRRAAEIDGMVLHSLPAHEQAIAARLFERAPQRDALAAPGAAEHHPGLGHASLELAFKTGLHVDLSNFQDHRGLRESQVV